MGEEVRHNCGLCVTHSLHDAYDVLNESLQHRGREAAGICCVGDRIDVLKFIGPVKTFDARDLPKIFPGYNYHTYLGHVRYATRGRDNKILEDAHPHVIGGHVEYRGSHIIIRDCDMAIVHNGQIDTNELDGINRSELKSECDSEALLHYYREKGEKELMRKVLGSYTLAIADKTKKEVIVMRDRFGLKPGVLGLKFGKYCMASEDIAFGNNGSDEFVEDLFPGTIYYLNANGSCRKEKVLEPNLRNCFFEINYIANVRSIIDNESVRGVRRSLGEMLAEEFKLKDARYITYVPRCPETAARSYAAKTGKELIEVFYKMRGERSFQGSSLDERNKSITENLHFISSVREIISGQNLIVIDDSTIRGNNALRAIKLLKEEGGVNKMYWLNYTARIGIIGDDGVPRGCIFGVDMPPNDNFIVRHAPKIGDSDYSPGFMRNRTQEELNKALGVELLFISPDNMLRAFENVGYKRENLCTYCIGGKHPFHDIVYD